MMPNQLVPPSLLTYFADLEDPRIDAIWAVICGGDSWVDMAAYV